MDSMEQRVLAARQSRQAMESLLTDYLPLLKRLASQYGPGLDYDDRLSLSMVAFMDAARKYEPERGAFLAFAEICVRNRLTDESRRERQHGSRLVPLAAENELAVPDPCARTLEQQALSEEIAALDRRLRDFGISFADLPKVCPRQKGARNRCLQMAFYVVYHEDLRQSFLSSGRLPQRELAQQFGLSLKTLEKYRKYIATLIVLLLGDYPDIRAFLPKGGRP